MTTPITPPPELVQQWAAEIWHEGTPVQVALSDEHIAARAAAWGADQELEACCEWIREQGYHPSVPRDLHADRRPKPPSLKEQALKRLAEAELTLIVDPDGTIRRALEQLDD